MKKYALRSKEDLAVEIYMPFPDSIPNLDYSFHAGDWALCYPLGSKARAIMNTAEGLAEATSPMNEWCTRRRPVRFFRFEFKDKESLRIFWELVQDYL